MQKSSFKILIALVLITFLVFPLHAQIDPQLLAGLKARSIGPAGMSGRVTAIDVVLSNPDIIYIGAATGGLWKSENGGITWKPIFDDQPVASIGAIAVFQPNPDIVWVGTGEGNPRNSVSVGNGVYKSIDGGKTWTHLGLEESERINRIVLHPTNPNIAYVGVVGKTWGEHPQRGVFKTEDGGRTWKKILYVNKNTGCTELVMDPSNPNKLFAAMWDHRRWPWFFRSGGPGSGLYMTKDGGNTWKHLTSKDGLPEGELGRIGLAISLSQPNIVYALVEAKKSALLKSEDGGETWKVVNDDPRIARRPFYFANIRVDPELPNRIYNLHSFVQVSDDGGKTFKTLIRYRDIHPDFHAMWINPNDPTHIIVGNDGGVAISYDRGKTWRFVSNLPLAQFYHINVDMETPYNIYGGMQDNGSWRGPSEVWENGGIRNHHWEEVGFGDGFDTAPDPEDPLIGYSMSQQGFLMRWNLHTGERKDIRPPAPDGVRLRFNWNAGFAIDPFDHNTIYYGSQFVHKSTDRGDTWSIISPDLTTNNPEWQKQYESGGLTPDVTGAENYTTIIAIAPSPVQQGVIWVGTDDGRVHVTRDGGKTWTSVEKNIKGVPPNTWVPHIEPSKFDAATAFVVFDDHRRSNWTPYVFKTNNFGKSWKSLATKDLRGYVHVIEQDPVKPDLLFLGTEFGLYVSVDGGKQWIKWTHGFPTVAVRDLVVHPREHDLVIGTHGRAAYIIDDIRPLRTLTPELLQEAMHLFDIPDAIQYMVKQTGESRFPGHTEFRGKNQPYGALITYSLNIKGLPRPEKEEKPSRQQKGKEKKPQVEIKISDEAGKVVRTFKGPAKLGINRVAWDLRADAFKEPRREEEERFFPRRGPLVVPGTYTVTIKYKDHEVSGKVNVLPDPRYDIPKKDRIAKWETIQEAGRLQNKLTDAINRIRSTREDIKVIVKKARIAQKEIQSTNGQAENNTKPYKKLIATADSLQKSLDKLERKLWTPPKTKGIVGDRDAMSKIGYVLRSLNSSFDAPTEAQKTYLRQARALIEKRLKEVNEFFITQVAEFRQQVEQTKIGLLSEFTDMKINK